MVYAPQRRHAVASLATCIQVIGLLQHLYTPNILILISRILVQVQIANAALLHPTRSLFQLFFLLTATNLAAVLLHALDFVAGMAGGKGVLLDFVRQARPASMTRVLLLDLLLYGLQITSMAVSYINNHSTNLPTTPSLPFDDPLLPPEDPAVTRMVGDDEELDLESGRASRRRKGKGKDVGGDDDEIWPEEAEEGIGQASSPRSRLLSSTPPSHSSSRREPPLIFSLSLPHLINLIFYLPAPPPPPRTFSGGTPATTPPQTPAAPDAGQIPPTTAAPDTAATADAAHGSVNRDGNEGEDEGDGETSPSSRRIRRGAAGLMPDVGPIPGDYWVRNSRGT